MSEPGDPTLAEWAKQRTLTAEEAASFVATLARRVAAAHQAGETHGALDASNILVGASGPRFGPAPAPPGCDGRACVLALGGLLRALLGAGTPSPALEAILARACASDPAARPTATALADELLAVAIAPRQPPRVRASWWRVAPLHALAVAALVVLGLEARRRTAELPGMVGGLLDADAAAIAAEAQRPATERVAVAALAATGAPLAPTLAAVRSAGVLPLVRIDARDVEGQADLADALAAGEPLLVALDGSDATEWTVRARKVASRIPVARRSAVRLVERVRGDPASFVPSPLADLVELEGEPPRGLPGPIVVDLPRDPEEALLARLGADTRIVALLAKPGVRLRARSVARLLAVPPGAGATPFLAAELGVFGAGWGREPLAATRLTAARLVLRAAGRPNVAPGPELVGRFTDLPAERPGADEVAALVADGVLPLGADGRFAPDQPVSRAALAAWTARALRLPDAGEDAAAACERAGFAPARLADPVTLADLETWFATRRAR